MPAHDSITINAAVRHRRYSRPYAITLSNTVSDKNLQRNGVPFAWIQNVGTGGLVMIAWEPDGTLVDIYLATGQDFDGGAWQHAKILGTTAGVDLRGFLGVGSEA